MSALWTLILILNQYSILLIWFQPSITLLASMAYDTSHKVLTSSLSETALWSKYLYVSRFFSALTLLPENIPVSAAIQEWTCGIQRAVSLLVLSNLGS